MKTLFSIIWPLARFIRLWLSCFLIVAVHQSLPAQDAYEPDNSWDEATTITPGISQQGHSIDPVGDVDWVTFRLDEPQNAMLETSGQLGDTVLWLYDENLSQIAYNDDLGPSRSFGGPLFSRLVVYLEPGTYFARVEESGNDDTISDSPNPITIRLELFSSNPDGYEPDNSWDQATTITPGVPQTDHSIDSAYDEDWVTFRLIEDSGVVLGTSATSRVPLLWLYDENLTEIAFGDNGGLLTPLSFSRVGAYLEAGTYFANTAHGVWGSDSDYSISLSLFPRNPDSYEPDDSSDGATTITPGVPQTAHSIDWVYDKDWVAFRLTEDSNVFLETSGPSGDTELTLHGETLNTIAYNGSSGTGRFSRIVRSLKPGTYFGEVQESGNDDQISSYTISLAVGPSPGTVSPIMHYGLGTLEDSAYSPAGEIIATARGIGVVLWDAETGERLRILSAPGHLVVSVAFSPDGAKVLTGSKDTTAKLWDAETGAEIRTFSGHTYQVSSVAFSPDGTKVLTGSYLDGAARLWDAATGEEIRTFSGDTTGVRSVAFSPDGTKILAGGGPPDYAPKLWDAETGEEILTFSGHTDMVNSVAFSPDGTKVLTGAGNSPTPKDHTAKLWDAETGEEIRTFYDRGSVQSVAFSPDGTKVLTGSGGVSDWGGSAPSTTLWDAETGEEIRTFSTTRSVHSVAFSPDGTKVLTGRGGLNKGPAPSTKLWDAETGEEIRTFSTTSSVSSVAFSPDGAGVLTGSSDRTALRDAATGAEIRSFSGHTSGVGSVAFSPDGTKVLTGSSDGTAKLWDTATGGEIRTFSGSPACFSPDGTKVLTGSADDTAKLWDAATGAEIRTFTGHANNISSVAFSPDGTKTLTGSTDTTAKLWDTETGEQIRIFGHTDQVASVGFSPDGTKILTGSSTGSPDYRDGAKLWDAETGEEIRTFSGHTHRVNSVAFSPDGTKVLTGSWDIAAKLWDAQTGEELRTFAGHTSNVFCAAFSPDGTKVLTSAHDGSTFLWSSGVSERKKDKLIIVAGGGSYVGNAIADQSDETVGGINAPDSDDSRLFGG